MRSNKTYGLQDSHETSLTLALLLKITGSFLLSEKFQGSYLSLNMTLSFKLWIDRDYSLTTLTCLFLGVLVHVTLAI